MNNLSPEQRPDRNGNIVTRWVRSSVDKVNKALDIPPVSASRTVTFEAEIQRKLQAQVEAHRKAQEEIGKMFRELEITRDARFCRDAYLADDDIPSISNEGMNAFRSFRNVAKSEGLLVDGKIATAMHRMAGHVMMNPADGPIMENMVIRGVKDSDTALGVLKELTCSPRLKPGDSK